MAGCLIGSVAIVAGGARGIGRACALRLAELGANVAVLDIDLRAAAAFDEELTAATVEDELRDRAGDGMAVQCDLTDPQATDEAISQVVERWSRLDILVIPAGGAVTPFARSAASKTTDEDFDKLVDVNMRVVVNSARSAAPHMRASGGGSIVTLASEAAHIVAPAGFGAAYAMTKAGVVHFTRYLATELGPDHIRVNCVAPGVVRTSRVLAQTVSTGFVDAEAAKAIPLGRQGEPSDIADAVQYFTSPLSAFVTGQVLGVNGGAVMH